MKNATDARLFDKEGRPTPETADLIDELMPWVKRRKRTVVIDDELWQRIEAWYKTDGLLPMHDQRLMREGVPNIVFLGIAWVPESARESYNSWRFDVQAREVTRG